MKNNKLQNNITIDDYTYELFKPTAFRPYKVWFQSMYWSRYLRLVMQAMRGSLIYYMKDSHGEIVGYIHLEKGNRRYPWSKKEDWIISPYAIKSDYRGRGLGGRIISDFCNNLSKGLSGNVYAEVRKNNPASSHVLQNNGFAFYCYATVHGLLRHYVVVEKEAEYIVYKMFRER